MKNITPGMLLAPLLIAGALFAGASHSEESQVMVTINGEQLTQDNLRTYIGLHSPETNPADNQAVMHLLEGLIGRELFYQEGVKQKVEQDPQFQALLEEQRRSLIAQALVDKHVNENPISEEELRGTYDSLVAANKTDEYQTRHILLDNEGDAAPILAKLKNGGNFAELAKKHSTDFSANGGGDMGWLTPGSMAPAYGEAVKRLKDGEYTTEAVSTEYGWHIIKLEQSRSVQPPAYEMVRGQVLATLQQQRIGGFLEMLRGKAEVKFPE